MPKRKSTDVTQVGLRLPERLRRMVEASAKKNGRSLNNELVRRIEQSFAPEGSGRDFHLYLKVVLDQFNNVLTAVGKPELVVTDFEKLLAERPAPADQEPTASSSSLSTS